MERKEVTSRDHQMAESDGRVGAGTLAMVQLFHHIHVWSLDILKSRVSSPNQQSLLCNEILEYHLMIGYEKLARKSAHNSSTLRGGNTKPI